MNGHTPLNELPDLEDLDMHGQGQGQGRRYVQSDRPVDHNYDKYLRAPHKLNVESGMAPYGGPPQGMPMGMPMGIPQQGQQEMMMNGPYSPGQPGPPSSSGQAYIEKFAPSPPQFNCIDIARHIQDCPICSKFYSSDKTIYIIVIVILAIVCLLLLKKVLNV